MENSNEDTSELNNIIIIAINKFEEALKNPQKKELAEAANDIKHLLPNFDLEEIISDSNSTSSVAERKFSESSFVSFFLLFLKHEQNLDHSNQTFPLIPSANSINDEEIVSQTALNAAENEIKQLADQGPAGIAHLSSLSHVVNRKIRVWSSSMTLHHVVGQKRSGESLNVQYHSNPDGIIGHWTLLGNNDPVKSDSSLNDCLFNAIAEQTGLQPDELRQKTIQQMKKNIHSLANRILTLAQLEQCGHITLMLGGARYQGKSASDAGKILDASQSGRNHPNHTVGHPRGHASCPTTTEVKGSAENYSRSGWKTAFLNRNDQNQVAHQALTTSAAQKAMEELNKGGERRMVRIPASELSNLPKGIHFNDGERGSISEIKELVLVLCHHAGHAKDPNYNVFVLTLYPTLKNT